MRILTNILRQNLGGLRLLVRFEVDACVESDSNSSLDGLVRQTTSLNIATATSQKASESLRPIINGLQVMRTSNLMVPQASLVEIKTKKLPNGLKWNDVYPQLYLSGTPNLMVGYHLSGNFTAIERYHPDDSEDQKMVAVREKTQEGVNKLAVVLRLIRDAVLALTENNSGGDRSERLLSLICQKKDLKLYERTGGSKLPKEVVAHFCDQIDG